MPFLPLACPTQPFLGRAIVLSLAVARGFLLLAAVHVWGEALSYLGGCVGFLTGRFPPLRATSECGH